MTENTTNAQAVIDTATRAADPKELDPDGRFLSVVVPDGGEHVVVDLEQHREHLRPTPRRKTGAYKVHDADSFLAYVKKHGDADSEVWADTIAARVTGVLNAHGSADTEGDGQRWEDHRVFYDVALTDGWKAWIALDGKLGDQRVFAEHIEDRSIDIIEPSGADMLELAQTFQATIGVNFESSKRLSSGERQLEYRETVDARAGKAGRLDIPEVFSLALVPFEGADAFRVTARLRYRITDGNLRIGYKLERPRDVLDNAFLSVVGAIRAGLHEADQHDIPVLRGTPRG